MFQTGVFENLAMLSLEMLYFAISSLEPCFAWTVLGVVKLLDIGHLILTVALLLGRGSIFL